MISLVKILAFPTSQMTTMDAAVKTQSKGKVNA